MISVRIDAHPSVDAHVRDMYAVFGFARGNGELTKWMEFISSDMIDNTEFHYKLYEKYGYMCYSPSKHRLLFHWGFNSKPWSRALENDIRCYALQSKWNASLLVTLIRIEVKMEQIRRNRLVNRKTEDLFGFGHGGTDARFANFFASIAYDVHLLGDYVPGNSRIEILEDLDAVVEDIIARVNRIDPVEGKRMVNILKHITDRDIQKKAEKLMVCLKEEMPKFIKKARRGSIYRRLEKRVAFIE